MLAVAFTAASPAMAKTYKLRTFNPGVKPSAGVLTPNPTTPTTPTTPVEPPAPPPPSPTSVLEFTSATPIDLGSVQRGAANGLVVDVTARSGDVEIQSFSINGAYSPPFEVTGTTCPPVLAKDQTCSINVSMTTLGTTPGDKDGSFIVRYVDSKAAVQKLASQIKRNILFGRIALSNTSQIFPAQDVNTVGAAFSTTLTNSGTGTLTVNGITPPAGFRTDSVSCVTASGTQSSFPVTLRNSLVSADACTLSFKFAPTAAIAYNGTLGIDSDSYTGASTYFMSGTGQTPIDYATLTSTLFQGGTLQMSNGNLTGTYLASTVNPALYRANKQRSSGKYYVEFTTTIAGGFTVGMLRNPANLTRGFNYFGLDFGGWDGHAAFNSAGPRTLTPNTRGTVIANWSATATAPFTVGMKIDLDTGLVVLVGSDCQDKSSFTLGNIGTTNFAPAIGSNRVIGGSFSANFGQFQTNCPVPAGFNKGWF